MFERILVPTDFHDLDAAAFTYARELALAYSAEIYLLHVIETLRDTPIDEVRDFYDKLEGIARRKLDECSRGFAEKDIPCYQDVVFGVRPSEILNFIAAKNISLVVLQSQRLNPQNPAEGWGSLSHKLAVMCQCPVMLVK